MHNITMQLKPLQVTLDQLMLDPNNPRLARSLNLRESLDDSGVIGAQTALIKLFENNNESDPNLSEDESDSEEGPIKIGDLVHSMQQIGFVRVDQVVVRRLEGESDKYLVIEGNRRIAAAKFVRRINPKNDQKAHHEQIINTLNAIEVLLLETHGLTNDEIHHQIGVILGLRHFGQVLPWGALARAVNIFNEYLRISPEQIEFKFESKRIGDVAGLLSESRASVLAALKTYIGYQQLKKVFPNSIVPQYYSLIQACVINKKLATHNYVVSSPETFLMTEESLENLNAICEFDSRDSSDSKVLPDPESVSKFSQIYATAKGHEEEVVKGYASTLVEKVLNKEFTVDDANAEIRRFLKDRKWVQALETLFQKVNSPTEILQNEEGRLILSQFDPSGNELMALQDARVAFRNIRRIYGV